MQFDQQTLDYLAGKQFSNSYPVPLPFHEPIPNRVVFLSRLVAGKKVIHLGCLDHLPLIDEKIARRQWLHKELTERASKCIGIDIDSATRTYVAEKYGYTNILIHDFTQTKTAEVTEDHWDFAILGELLEHIDNPVAFLSAIRENYFGCLDRIVITVPNAWTQTTMRMAKKSIEIINTDHRYWFTPYTLAKVVLQSGLKVEEMHFANRVPLTKSQLVAAKLKKILGNEPRYDFTFASSIICIAKL